MTQRTSFMDKAAGFPSDITILKANVRLFYEDGTPAGVSNGIYNHHVVFADTNKLPVALFACPGKKPKKALPISVLVATSVSSFPHRVSTSNSSLEAKIPIPTSTIPSLASLMGVTMWPRVITYSSTLNWSIIATRPRVYMLWRTSNISLGSRRSRSRRRPLM